MEIVKGSRNTISYKIVYDFALQLFGYDKDKMNQWWMTKNADLDNLSPFEMVRDGKGKELMRMIQTGK